MESIIKSSVHRPGVQQKITRCILLAAGIMAFVAHVGWSAPSFSASAGSNSSSGTSPVSQAFVLGEPVPDGFIGLSASASAGPGACAVLARATLSVSSKYANPSGWNRGVGSSASFTLDDIIISQIPGSNAIPNPDGRVSAVLNLHTSGTIGARAMAIAGVGGRGYAAGFASELITGAVTYSGNPDNNAIRGEIGADQRCDSLTGCDPLLYEATGILAGFTGDNEVSSGVFYLPTNTPVGLSIAVRVGENCRGDISGTDLEHVVSIFADGVSDLSHTVSFPSAGPVFNLPDGFTVNSESGLIVNNRYLPNLMIALSGTNAVLTWLASPGAMVHSTESLSPPINWTQVTNIVAMGRTNRVAVDASSGSKFFRLIR